MNLRSLAEQAVTNRIIDACLNRGAEALRVIEDVARFALDDAFLSKAAKDLRHEAVRSVLQAVPSPLLLASRETDHDVGTGIQGADEYHRTSLADVLASNFPRAEQALRTLEECCKLESPETSRALEQLRYQVYSLERSFGALLHGRRTLEGIAICVLADGGGDTAEFRRRLDEIADAGHLMIQLRDAGLTDRDLLSRAQQLVQLARDRSFIAIVNDRVDIAAAADADGVHLGQDDLPVHAARRLLGANAILGVSTHSLAQARRAVKDGANYIGIGPVFPSRTKQFGSFIGVETLRAVADELTIPSFAIGGITPGNVGEVIAAGAHRIAVQSAVWSAENPSEILAALQSAVTRE